MNTLSSKLTAFAAALAMNGLVFGALGYLFALQSHPNMSAIAFNKAVGEPREVGYSDRPAARRSSRRVRCSQKCPEISPFPTLRRPGKQITPHPAIVF